MYKRIVESQWGYAKGRQVFKYHRDFPEALHRDSRISYNPVNGVCEVYFNSRTPILIDAAKSATLIKKALKALFQVNRCICIVDQPHRAKGDDGYAVNTQFYFNATKQPDADTALQVISAIEDNFEPALFKKTDAVTGEVEYFSYCELPVAFSYQIARFCLNPTLSPKGRKKIISGGYWTFA